MNKENIGYLVGAVGVCIGGYLYVKMNTLARSIGSAINSLDDCTPVDISKSLIEAAVQKAVDREVSVVAKREANALGAEMRSKFEQQIKGSVDAEYKRVERTVAEKIATQVKNIDEVQLKRNVQQRAEDAIVAKFNGCLDDTLTRFNHSLENVAKIYESIADAVVKKPQDSKGMVFRIE